MLFGSLSMFLLMSLFLQFFTLTNAFNQLSLSGGGSFGAVEIGILKRLLETDTNTNTNTKTYDLYTGISAGALNAGFFQSLLPFTSK